MCFACLTGQSFKATMDRLAARFGYAKRQVATVEQLIASLDALEIERNAFLQRLAVFARRRITSKCRGQRRPGPAEIAALYEPRCGMPASKKSLW